MADLNSTLLLEVALDLANNITSSDRFDRLLSSLRKAINCDAVVLLAVQGDLLLPLATQGLSIDTLGRRFFLKDHPRLSIICDSDKPIRFPSDSKLPDPYDGLLLANGGDLPVHSCMGLPLYADGTLIGVVTIDSLKQDAFVSISERTLQVMSAMSAAALKTAIQLEKLEQSAKQAQDLVEELTHAALSREGGEIIGQSPAMQALKNDINLVASSDYSVLIQGQTGVGKELVARTIHMLSKRRKKQLVHLNCASLPETLAESELFGHSKGAFTGAERKRPGKFLLADGGTIFLDEVGELPLSIQSKLLRVLQSGEIQPVGIDEVSTVNVRVIAATNRDLRKEVERGCFRADLYHRLSVYPINVPPLKERQQDVILLAGFFLEITARKLGIRQLKLSHGAEKLLTEYTWPGNVRELEHVISRAALKAKKELSPQGVVSLQPEHLDLNLSAISQEYSALPELDIKFCSLREATNIYQKHIIMQKLTANQGNWTATARELAVDRANLTRLAKRLGIDIKKIVSSS